MAPENCKSGPGQRGQSWTATPFALLSSIANFGSCTEEGIQEHGFTFTWEKALWGAGVSVKKNKGAPVCERGINYFLVCRGVAHPARVGGSCCKILPVCKLEGTAGPPR